jgi:hypothetical protein
MNDAPSRIRTKIALYFVCGIVEECIDTLVRMINEDAGSGAVRVSRFGPQRNSVVYSADDAECAWVFYDPGNTKRSPWDLGMQKRGSDQCSASHALCLAHRCNRGDPLEEATTPEVAYAELIRFWDKFVVSNLETLNGSVELVRSLQMAIDYNVVDETNGGAYFEAMEGFPRDPRGALALLGTEYAKRNVPLWDD